MSYAFCQVNSLPNDKFLDLSKFKAFADDKINVAHFVLGKVENIVGKGENAGYQHFLLFLQCFQKDSFSIIVFVYLSSLPVAHLSDAPRRQLLRGIVHRDTGRNY